MASAGATGTENHRLHGEWIQTEHRVIDEAAGQPGHPALSCLYSRLSSTRRRFFISSFSRLLRGISDEELAGETERAIYAHVHYRVPPSCPPALSLSLHLYLLSPPARPLSLSFSFVRAYLEKDTHGPSWTKTVAQTYVIAGVSASFLLRISSFSVPLRLCYLEKGRRGMRRRTRTRRLSYLLLLFGPARFGFITRALYLATLRRISTYQTEGISSRGT